MLERELNKKGNTGGALYRSTGMVANALGAVQAGGVQPRHTDPVALAQTFHAGADGVSCSFRSPD